MRIRRAAAADVPLLVALNEPIQNRHAEVFPTRFRRDVPSEIVAAAFAQAMESPASLWLVAEEDQPTGFVSAEIRQRDESWCSGSHQICYLTAIVVDPEFRHRGIARALLGELMREVHCLGIDAIDLDVWAFNAEAREAFACLGFQTMMERMTLALGPNTQPEPTAATDKPTTSAS